MMASAERFDRDTVRRFLTEIHDPAAGCFEIRIPKSTFDRGNIRPPTDQWSRTLAGYYSDIATAVRDLSLVRDVSAYVTVNPVRLDMLARANSNKIARVGKDEATGKAQIAFLDNAFLDVDSIRDKGISATPAEHGRSLALLGRIMEENPAIRAAAWWGSSGNGGWGLIRILRLPNDPESNRLVDRFLAVLGRIYTGADGEIDQRTKDPSRIMGIPGMRKCKGTDTPERPWRLATILSPEGHVRVPLDLRAWLEEHDDFPDVEPGLGPVLFGNGQTWSPSSSAQMMTDSSRTIKRAAHFVAAIPPAVSGQGGHDQTFSVATALVKGFSLSVSEAWPFMQGYNATCQPPWTEAELWHKVEDAHEKPDDKPRGYLLLLGDRDEQYRVAFPSAAQVFDISDAVGPEQVNGHVNGDLPVPVLPQPGGPVATPGPVDTAHQFARTMIAGDFFHIDGTTLRYWREEFHFWHGSCYRVIPKKELTAMVARSVETQLLADYTARMIAHAMKKDAARKEKPPKLRSVTTGLVGDVIQALSSLVPVWSHQCPQQPWWIEQEGRWPVGEILPTKDALIHLPSFVAGLHSTMKPTPRFFGRYALDYRFDPEAPEPAEWLAFLDTSWPEDPESIALLQEWMGYLLTPDTSQQKIALLIGPPRSGKGTIARVIRALLGQENVVNPTLSYLSTNFGMASLIGKPAAIVTDARISGRTDTAVVVERLLSISGEDSQTVDRKHKAEVTLQLPTRFMILSNELPNIKDASGALAARMLVLQLTHSFLGNEDTTLYSRFVGELPGILRWAIKGWSRLRQQERFTVPAASRDLAMAMADVASPIKTFVRERCKVRREETVAVGDLYGVWKTWCDDKGRDHPGTEEEFGRMLRAAVPGLKKARVRVGGIRVASYMGIRLLTPDEFKALDRDDGDEEPEPQTFDFD